MDAVAEQAALAANEEFYAAFTARDASRMDVLWARGTGVTCIHPGWRPLVGRDEVMASWDAILANPAQARVVAGGASVTLMGDVATVLCREFVAGSALVATNVFVREAGSWRITHHHSSPVVELG